MTPNDRPDLVRSWSLHLGLAATELLPSSYPDHHRHFALMDGVEGSFAFSEEVEDEGLALDWTWSSQLSVHVSIAGDAVLARQVTPNAPLLKFSRKQIERNLEGFLDVLASRQVQPPASIVDHVVRCFRSHRHVAAQHNLSSEESLGTFLTMVDDKIRSQTSPLDPRLPPDHRDRLYEELSFNPLMRREAHLALTMRHAASVVFQETHAELSTDPVQKPLIGLATVPGRATDNRAGAYYTPPGLARLLTDLAVAPYLDRDIIRIADPACGSGIFLSEAACSLQRLGFQGRIELIGLDLSGSAIEMARFALKHNEAAAGATIRLCREDFLNVTRPLNADVIVTNPPWGAVPYLEPAVRDRAKEILGTSFVNRPDLSMVFTTLALSHLRQGGTLATLVPAGVLGQAGGKRWRSSIVEATDVDLVAVLGDHGLFRYATVNVAALVLRNTRPPQRLPSVMLWASQQRGASSAALRRLRRWHDGDRRSERTPAWSIQRVPPNSLLERDDWTPRPMTLGDLPERLVHSAHIATVGSLFHVELGIRAGRMKNRLQLSSIDFKALPTEERRLFRPVAETRSVNRGRVRPVSWAFYPDSPMSAKEIGNKAPVFFERFLSDLTIGDTDVVDFERPRRATNTVRRPRIVARAFVSVDSFAVDDEGSYVVIQGYSWLPQSAIVDGPFHVREMLFDYSLILNSTVFFLLARESARIVAGGQVDGAKRQVAKIPLPDLSALYLDFPEVRSAAAKLREVAPTVYPDRGELDRFAAKAYRTDIRDWPVA